MQIKAEFAFLRHYELNCSELSSVIHYIAYRNQAFQFSLV